MPREPRRMFSGWSGAGDELRVKDWAQIKGGKLGIRWRPVENPEIPPRAEAREAPLVKVSKVSSLLA